MSTTSYHYDCHVFEDTWQQHESEITDKEEVSEMFRFEFRLGRRVRILLCLSDEGDDQTISDTQRDFPTRWFLVDRRRFMSETTSRSEICSLLSKVNIPLEFQEDMIQRISSLAIEMAKPASNTGRNMLRMVVAMEFLRLVKLDEAVVRATMESMNDGEFRAVPATKSSIEALEKVRIQDSGTASISSCVICLEELPFGSEATCMPCSHVYHGGCIVQWLERSNLCPLCRFQMPC